MGIYDELAQLDRPPSPATAPSVSPPDASRTAAEGEKAPVPPAAGETAPTAAYSGPQPGDNNRPEDGGLSASAPPAGQAPPGRNPARRPGSPGTRETGEPEDRPAGETKAQPGARPAGPAARGAEVQLAGQMEAVRRAMREVGRERADVSLTAAEKEALREIAYLRTQRGKRTTISDVIRVAVNWLLQDHASRKERSLLARSLDRIQS